LTGAGLVYFSVSDVLPGEEDLHERLQRQLVDSLIHSHRSGGLVVQVEAKLRESGSWGMLRSIQAAPGRYSCELVEISADGCCLDSRFFTLVPPEEGRSRASVVILAKAAALIGSPDVRPLGDGQFDELARQCIVR